MNLIKRLGIWGILGWSLAGCGSATKANAVLKAYPGETIQSGEYVILDAGDSDYTTIKWFLNDKTYSACSGEEMCRALISAPGSYEFKIEVQIPPRNFREEGSVDTATVTITGI